jgi:hypothetical protein
MENQTGFNLNTALENWRRELAGQINLTEEVRRELETHLCAAITGFQHQGLDDEESFWLARRRVGRPQQLNEEFEKVDPTGVWRERLFWMAFGITVFRETSLFIGNMGGIALIHLSPGLRGIIGMFWWLLGGLPAFFIAVLMARGWLVSKPPWFLQTRYRLAASWLLLQILYGLTQMEVIRLFNLEAGLHSFFTRVALNDLFRQFLGILQFSAAPLILLIWFLPGQKREAIKHA